MDNQTRQYLNDGHVDVDAGLRVLEGVADPDALYLRLLRKFSGDRDFGLFMDALREGDMELAQRASHSLKGVCGNLGLTNLYKTSTKINDELKTGKWPDSALIQALEREYQLVQGTIAGLENRQ